MKFAGWVVSTGLILAATAAGAQVLVPADAGLPYRPASDFEGPYGSMPPAPPRYPPPYAAPAPYSYEPALMPPQEVYAVLRENGLLPLGIPHRRGYVYEISVLDRTGEHGRLVIDGRTGRIIRFMPAYQGRMEYAPPALYGAQAALLPPTTRDMPRPPSPIPHVASRSVPLPAPKPAAADMARTADPIRSEPAPRPAAGHGSLQAQASAPVTQPAAEGEAKPQAQVKPTQDMPPVQGLE